MDKKEARTILRRRLAELRLLPYRELAQLVDQDVVELEGPSGTTYQLETMAWLEDKQDGLLRVTVAIDDKGWRAFLPMTDSFLIRPDGTFYGEE
jgi:hypothetical protein